MIEKSHQLESSNNTELREPEAPLSFTTPSIAGDELDALREKTSRPEIEGAGEPFFVAQHQYVQIEDPRNLEILPKIPKSLVEASLEADPLATRALLANHKHPEFFQRRVKEMGVSPDDMSVMEHRKVLMDIYLENRNRFPAIEAINFDKINDAAFSVQEIAKSFIDSEEINQDLVEVASELHRTYPNDPGYSDEMSLEAPTILERVNPGGKYGDFSVYVIEDPKNIELAAAKGGGVIVMSAQGFQDLKDNEAAIEFIFAHEIAHDLLEHQESNPRTLTITDETNETLIGRTSAARLQELQADFVAGIILAERGEAVDIQSTTDFLKKEAGYIPSHFETHPSYEVRTEALQAGLQYGNDMNSSDRFSIRELFRNLFP